MAKCTVVLFAAVFLIPCFASPFVLVSTVILFVYMSNLLTLSSRSRPFHLDKIDLSKRTTSPQRHDVAVALQ